MPVNLEEKKAIVAEVEEVVGKSLSAIMADYRGLTAEDMTELRAQARENGVYLRVVRNTLIRRALEKTEFACMVPAINGPLIMALSMEDPGAGARVFKKFIKKNDKLEVKVLSIGGKILEGSSELEKLASLPTLCQARAMLLGTMMGPITKLVRTFNDVPGRITRVVSAVADSKKAS